jgi:hypothetical protein
VEVAIKHLVTLGDVQDHVVVLEGEVPAVSRVTATFDVVVKHGIELETMQDDEMSPPARFISIARMLVTAVAASRAALAAARAAAAMSASSSWKGDGSQEYSCPNPSVWT